MGSTPTRSYHPAHRQDALEKLFLVFDAGFGTELMQTEFWPIQSLSLKDKWKKQLRVVKLVGKAVLKAGEKEK